MWYENLAVFVVIVEYRKSIVLISVPKKAKIILNRIALTSPCHETWACR